MKLTKSYKNYIKGLLGEPTNLQIAINRAIAQRSKPRPKLTVSQWADEFRIISAGNAEPGRYRTDRAPYQREPMDCASDPKVNRITLQWGAQLGKTEIINNIIGYGIHQNPRSQMMMHPTQGDLNTWLETKLNPLLTDTPEVAELVAKPRARDGVNNNRMKSYPGGFLMFAWSGSPNTMRGRSAPVILCDEVDGYEATPEGDPINLLEQRSATFGDQRLLVVTSTPTIKGASRVEDSFHLGDQRRFYLPCPHCGEYQTLKWGQVTWLKDDNGDPIVDSAVYACEACGGSIEDGHKMAMLRRGEWRAERPFRGHASFHLSELYSPFRKWRDIVQSFLDKKASHDLQSFVNVSLAETWEEEGERVDASPLYHRREFYKSEVPKDALVLTAGVDVQDDRLEASVYGFGLEGEKWLIRHTVLEGHPGRPELWKRLDEFLLQSYRHETGVFMKVAAASVDSGGHYTDQVYKFCKERSFRHVYAIKGSSQRAAPIVSRPSTSNKAKVKLYSIGVSTAKELIYGHLKIDKPGPGYVHFPRDAAFIDEEFFEQLTAEKRVTKYVKGFAVQEFIKTRPRNEALDCFVYALAAFEILTPNLKAVLSRLKPTPEPEPTPADEDALHVSEVQKRRRAAIRPARRKPRGRQW
ncbi:MAG: terminase [Pseudomonas sp.]|nr:terminase [Pseudomonas sp.]